MSFQPEITSKGSKSGPSMSKNKPVWKWVGAILLGVFIVGVLVAAWIWSNRYSVLEQYAITTLEERGIEAQLSIKRANFDTLQVDNVELTYRSERKPFFTAKRIEADYVLKEALQGNMKRFRLVEPTARITLDENFKITDGWLPPKSESSPGGLSIPESGFFIEDATFNLETPYGSPEISMSASIRETDQFEATLVIDETDLDYKDWALTGSARLDLDVKGDKKEIDSLIRLQSLSRYDLNLNEATLEVKGALMANTTLPIELESLNMTFLGDIEGMAGRLETAPFTLDESQFVWDGQITRQTDLNSPMGLDGQIDLSTEQFTFADEARAKNLAQMLTLSDPLSSTPIAQHFAPSLTKILERLLKQSSIKTTADINFQNEKAVITLMNPLDAVQDNIELEISGTDQPIYSWNRITDDLTLSFNAALNRPVPMTLKNTRIEADTVNGWQLSNITKFLGNMNTTESWKVVSDKEPTRLAPFKAVIDYQGETARRLNITGGVDFDGRIPGGYAKGFETAGRVNLRLPPSGEQGLMLSYAPNRPRVNIGYFETETDWDLQNITLDLADGNNIFSLIGKNAKIGAGLENVRFNALNKLDERDFDMELETAQAKGALNTQSGYQNWTIIFDNADVQSNNFPVQDTSAQVPRGMLSVLRSNNNITFDFNSDSIDVSVPQVRVNGMKVHAQGTPENYRAEHSGGIFKSETMDIPNWPVSGTVRFTEGEFTGDAVARIPKANNTPLSIEYSFKDGAGSAHAMLESLTFKTGGLQPQTIAPALAGKVAAVEGTISADMEVSFANDEIQGSGGVLNIMDMNFGTAPGPVEGLNTQIEFSSLMPFQTAGRQVMTVENFDPGIPLEDGTIEYELVPEGVKIYSARWPLNVGAFELDPFIWRYGADENRVVMRLNDISIDELLQSVGNEKLEATGTVSGVFPIVVRGLNVLVDDGYLEAKDGGIIRFKSEQSQETTDRFQGDRILDTWSSGDEGVYNDLAREALREFNYRELTASIDGPLDGDVELGVIFNGANKKVLNGQPFEFDINVQGELFNILRSFNSNSQIKSELLKKEADKQK
jgi:hypothetical protein